ncbi:hypothetical protein LQZ18_15525 [Lachnospiraceae bacterium ZAX-1]
MSEIIVREIPWDEVLRLVNMGNIVPVITISGAGTLATETLGAGTLATETLGAGTLATGGSDRILK